MNIFIRLECDNCLSHRDLDIGPLEDVRQEINGQLLKNRARNVGWVFPTENAVDHCYCPTCMSKAPKKSIESLPNQFMPSGRHQ